MSADIAKAQKIVDPYNFIRAEDFFQGLDRPASGGYRPTAVIIYEYNADAGHVNRDLRLRFDDGSGLAIRFVRPKIWKLHRDLGIGEEFGGPEHQSRNVVQPTVSKLVEVLDSVDKLQWDVELIDDERFLIFQSFYKLKNGSKQIATQLWIQKGPFKISAIQPLKSIPNWGDMPRLAKSDEEARVELPKVQGQRGLIVWETAECPLRYQGSATVISVKKPRTAAYLGFGEQGGKSLLRDCTFMNFLNYDNMLYDGVYGQGPLDPREPLYHSEPFWMEANALPGYLSKVGTFVDNYSHIVLDLGKTSQDEMRIATRFNNASFYIIAGENTQEVIGLYTSLVGRPWLKPRYALGYGQGAYGYDTRKKVEDCVREYRENDFPIDTLHIDVDLQYRYCTFTVDTSSFPDPKDMFTKLKGQGVKCCTNITPVINSKVEYPVHKELLEKEFYVKDVRYLAGVSKRAEDQRYMCYESGKLLMSNPNLDRPGFGDDYSFEENFNTGRPYHGGVNYGKTLGTPGFYPDLNRKEVRAWWGEQYRHLFDLGLEFVWQDMTSPSISKEYGDMKSFPARLLVSEDQDAPVKGLGKRPAIEIWSLYAYNLHKATFNGLNKLSTRNGKRNFIIGRGSFAGMHRYAGLWTGDNGSTWGFLGISVTQALSIGLSGLSICGGDVGGFIGVPGQKYVAPELLIRWYCACFLLPWFRNHYTGKPGQKLFQEPYMYLRYYKEHKQEIGEDEESIYEAVLPICRYYTKLRYSLIQMLYDGLFENIFTGLPIVKALVISETLDETLFNTNQGYLSNEYIVRKDLLVAPILTEADSTRGWRSVYLPSPDSWFKFNLRCDETIGSRLSARLPGGSHIEVAARIDADSSQVVDVTPMYIREGAIIPMAPPRNYVPDPTIESFPPCSITLHIYPGKENQYDMFLDDGVSRASAPKSSFLEPMDSSSSLPTALVVDKEAQSQYRQVRVAHRTITSDTRLDWPKYREVSVMNVWDGYGRANTARDIGPTYTAILWHEKSESLNREIRVEGTEHFRIQKDETAWAILVVIPIDADKEGENIRILERLDPDVTLL